MSLLRRMSCAAVVLALVAGACTGGSTEPDEAVPTPEPTPEFRSMRATGDAFVAAWEANAWEDMAGLVFDPEAEPGVRHADVWRELGVTATALSAAPIEEDLPRARMPITVRVQLEELGEWEYETTIGLVEVGPQWYVEWAPSTIHPGLVDNRRLERRRIWPQRGRIRGWDGEALRVERPVVRVGVEPRRIEDRDELLGALETLLDLDPEEVAAALDADGVQPDWFVPVATLRTETFPEVAETLEVLPGVVVRNELDRLAPTDDFAVHTLGTVGPVTAELLDELGAPYDATRIVGRSGLELVHERRLAGTPSGDVRLVDAAGQLVAVQTTFPGVDPVDVVTTLDADAQAAAEAVLADVTEPAALVAIDVETGGIRALVSRPVEEFARALSGRYPPGSTFKTVTAAAFIEAGGSAGSGVDCPGEVFVTGLRFTNAGGTALGRVTLQQAYAASCNTAFVNVSTQLEEEQLLAAAAAFGFETAYTVGLDTAGGAIPAAVDDAELAASSIGQGRVTASPVHMASVAAAVASGTWRSPHVVLDPEPSTIAEARPLDDAVVAELQAMMRSVVTGGTGRAAASAGSDISGKTGSAEFGDDDPPRTHAWFIGYRDDLAFAVMVEGGGAGGAVAAPIAAAFLAELDARLVDDAG
ncbi:MAG: penicillin-binding transpeptidase domain-containing protein [Actinomycetota bacterium]